MKFNQFIPYLLVVSILTISFVLNLNSPQVQSNVNPRVFNNTIDTNFSIYDYPPDTTLTYTGSEMVTGVPMPDYLTPTTDPAFNTTITRVSDQTIFGTGSEIFRHENSVRSAWNSDGTKILLGYGSGTAYILDGGDGTAGGTTSTGSSIEYELLDSIEIPNNQEVWSNTDPDLLYSITNDLELITIDVTTGNENILETFDGYDYVTIGEGKGNPSNGDEYLPLVAHNGTTKTMIIYDLQAQEPLETVALGTGDLESITMSQSGEYVVINWDDDGSGEEQGIKAFEIPATGSGSYHLYDYSGEGDTGYDATDEEVYVQAVDINGVNKITIINLNNDLNQDEIIDDEIQVRTVPETEEEWAATHVSCRNLDRRGWCYISDSNPDSTNPIPGYNETYALSLDGGTNVKRFAHHHQTDGSGIEAYAMSTVNRDGTRVIFASDWEDTDNPDYAYVAEYFEAEAEATQTPTEEITATPTPTPTQGSGGGGGGGGTATPTPTKTPSPTPSPTPAISGRGFDNIPASLSNCINNYEDKTTKLTDVEDDAFEGYILSLHCRSVISGYSDNTYRSDEYITRDALAKYIVNAFDISMDSSGSNFTDVPSNNSFYKYILTLKNESIIGGFSDGSFKPSDYVKRQEVTKFIVEAMKVAGEDVDLDEDTDFPDVDAANKFRTYIGFLETIEVNNETIISGYSDGKFKPDDYITRGQMAKMIENSVRYMDETEEEEEEGDE